MALSFFTKYLNRNQPALIIDVGSASVGAALVALPKQGNGKDRPHILATVREGISFQEALSSKQFLSAMNHALMKALRRIHAEKTLGGAAPSRIFCSLSSPWCLLKVRRISIIREDTFETSPETIERFIEDDVSLLVKEITASLPEHDLAIVEKNIIHTKLNGYEVANLYSKKVKNLELVSAISLSSRRVVDTLTQTIRQLFHSVARYGTFPLVMFSAVRDLFAEEKNFLFMDISGEATDVSLAEYDSIANSMSFPRGKNMFIREISLRLHTPHEEAATLFRMFLRRELAPEKQEETQRIVTNISSVWAERLKKAFEALGRGTMLPSTIFFTADIETKEFFTELLSRTADEFFAGKRSNVQYLDHEALADTVSYESGVARDPFLALAALFFQKQ